MNSPQAFDIGEESETAHGWAYEITRHHPDGSLSTHTIGLSWADHEAISGGIYPPSETIAAVFRLLDDWERSGEDDISLPARLDVSTVRRFIKEFDERVRQFVGLNRSDRSDR